MQRMSNSEKTTSCSLKWGRGATSPLWPLSFQSFFSACLAKAGSLGLWPLYAQAWGRGRVGGWEALRLLGVKGVFKWNWFEEPFSKSMHSEKRVITACDIHFSHRNCDSEGEKENFLYIYNWISANSFDKNLLATFSMKAYCGSYFLPKAHKCETLKLQRLCHVCTMGFLLFHSEQPVCVCEHGRFWFALSWFPNNNPTTLTPHSPCAGRTVPGWKQPAWMASSVGGRVSL